MKQAPAIFGVLFMEMKNVKIHVKSFEKSGGEQSAIETVSFGKMAEKNGKFYVFYDETDAVGMKGTKTTIKWDYDNVVIIRSGTVESRQEFAQGLECISVYKTPYMTFGLKTNTEYVYVYCRDGIWNIELEYMLELAGQERNEMKIKIVIEEDAHGY